MSDQADCKLPSGFPISKALVFDFKSSDKSVEDSDAYLAAGMSEVNMGDHQPSHPSKKSDPLVQLPAVEKLEEELKSHFYELRKGKVWFSEEIKREHRRLKTSLFQYILHSRLFAILTAPFIVCLHNSICSARSVRFHVSGRVLSRVRHTQGAARGLCGD
jgi:hypothetical protein